MAVRKGHLVHSHPLRHSQYFSSPLTHPLTCLFNFCAPHRRYHLEIQGRRRVRLISFSELDGYRMTRAQPFKDVSPEAPMLEQLTSLSAQVLTELQVAHCDRMHRDLYQASTLLHFYFCLP